jgi:tetratricopeptide (TPR) repeat protein
MKKILLALLFALSFSAHGQTAEKYYNLGLEKVKNQNYSAAVDDFSNAIMANPNYSEAYYNRGTAKLSLKEYKEAIADMDKAIALKPDYTRAYANRGVAKIKIEDIKGAIQDFDRVTNLDPANVSAYFMRGQLKLQDGNTKGGCYDLSKANDMGDKRAQKYISQYCGDVAKTDVPVNKNESLRLDWPDAEGWKVGSNQADNERKVIELLRNNETFDNWTEIGTMMVYPGVHNAPVDVAMNTMYEQAKKTCPAAKLTFLEKDEKAKYPWILFKIECGTDAPESQVWQIISTSNELYINFRAVKKSSVPDDLKNKWVAFFKTAEIVNQ